VRTLAARAVRLLGAIAPLAALAFAAGCGTQGGPKAEVGATAGVPGALPAGFRYRYRDSYRGWPLRPLHRQHPIRGSFLDPRGREYGRGGYHFGIDISVDDARPDPRAPRGLSHVVYAVESGEASDVLAAPRHHLCGARRVSVGHFDYWHVSPTVVPGQHVEAGEPIGWSCRGEWHVHLAEWTRVGDRRIWVDPLHRGGKVAPYTDTARPVVAALRFFGPRSARRVPFGVGPFAASAALTPTRLHGLVELRAEIGDPQSHWGFIARHPRWKTLAHPYRVSVTIRSRRTRRVVLGRLSFESDQLPRTPYLVHYAPGTVENEPIAQCAAERSASCAGSYWFRPFSRFQRELWDTRSVRNGAYVVTVNAWDIEGNEGSSSVRVVVANPVLGRKLQTAAHDQTEPDGHP
jgi:hypothetical protein